MPWISHVLILDDNREAIESLVPALPKELGKELYERDSTREALLGGYPPRLLSKDVPISVKVTTHLFTIDRPSSTETLALPMPFQVHLHLVNERNGRYDHARRLLNSQMFSVVVSDMRLAESEEGEFAGKFFIEEVGQIFPETCGLLYSAQNAPSGFDTSLFIDIKRTGKNPVVPLAKKIAAGVERYLEHRDIAEFVRRCDESADPKGDPHDPIVYQSMEFGECLNDLFSIARNMGPEVNTAGGRRPLACLLLNGPSGTGKSTLARLVRASSARRDWPIKKLNSAVLVHSELLKSELFGYRKGAFPGATEDRAGVAELVEDGMILIDDFHELPPELVPIFHTFLEDGSFSRVGEQGVTRRTRGACVITVETERWAQRIQSKILPPSFIARLKRNTPVVVSPLCDRPEDLVSQALWFFEKAQESCGIKVNLGHDVLPGLLDLPFHVSNSRELRGLMECAHKQFCRMFAGRRVSWADFREYVLPVYYGDDTPPPPVTPQPATAGAPESTPAGRGVSIPPADDDDSWPARAVRRAAKIVGRECQESLSDAEVWEVVRSLFQGALPAAWEHFVRHGALQGSTALVGLDAWEKLVRCYGVYTQGMPAGVKKLTGIEPPAIRALINGP